MPTDRQPPTRGDFPRVCDQCGVRWMWAQLTAIGDMRWACPDCKGELTANQISRYNARAKPLIVRPRKYAKDYIQTPIYDMAEASAFNFIAQVAPAGERDGANDPLAAAWAAIYMADVILQGKRPKNWDRTATTTIQRCLTYLATKQAGTGLIPSAVISDPWCGAITRDTDPLVGTEFSTTTWSTPLTIAAGIAWVKAYSALGTHSYLDNARKCASYLRHAQCADLQATQYTVYPAGGGRYHIGGLPESMRDFTGITSANYNIADVAGAWFLTLLAAIDDGRSYGDAASTGYYSAPTAATLATMSAELTAFAETGARDGGVVVCPLSTTAPKLTYVAAQATVGGAAAWNAVTDLRTRDLAMALRGIYEANGVTAKVTEMMTWLASFSSNPDNQTPATLREDQVVLGITGTYDPALCPADSVSATEGVETSGALYDWATYGLLSPILAANQAQMRTSKDTVSTSVRYSFYEPGNVYLTPIGSSGLSLQPIYRDGNGNLVGVSASGAGSAATAPTPPSEGLVFWVKGDAGVHRSGSNVTGWDDQGPLGQHLNANNAGNEPTIGSDIINGIPGISFPLGETNPVDPTLVKFLGRATNLKASDGKDFGIGASDHAARTVFAIIRPKNTLGSTRQTGGFVCNFREMQVGQTTFSCMFFMQAFFDAFRPIWELYSTDGPYGVFNMKGPDTAASVYLNVPMLVEWRSDYPAMAVSVNGSDVTLTPPEIAAGQGDTGLASPGFIVGCSKLGTAAPNFQGTIFEVLVWDRVLSGGDLSAARGYVASRYGLTFASSALPSVVRAARTGMAYRQDPGRYPLLRGN